MTSEELRGIILAALAMSANVDGDPAEIEQLVQELGDDTGDPEAEPVDDRSYAAIKGKEGYSLMPSKTNPRIKRWMKQRALPNKARQVAGDAATVGGLALGGGASALVGGLGLAGVTHVATMAATMASQIGAAAIAPAIVAGAIPLVATMLGAAGGAAVLRARDRRNKTLRLKVSRSEYWLDNEREYVDKLAQQYGLKPSVVAHALAYYGRRYDFAVSRGYIDQKRAAELAKQNFAKGLAALRSRPKRGNDGR